MPAKNKDIRTIADAPEFRGRVEGCCVAKAHTISLDTNASEPMKSWAANILNEMYKKRSGLVAAAAQLVAKSEMVEDDTKEFKEIIDLKEPGIATHIDTHIVFLAGNQPS